MKIITLQKIGFNHPSQANWSYGIYQVSLIDTTSYYNLSFTCKETFGGDSRFKKFLREKYNINVIELKSTWTKTGLPKITGISNSPVIDDEKNTNIALLQDIKTFMNI